MPGVTNIFSGAAWFRASLAPYLRKLRTEINQVATSASGAVELLYTDPVGRANGYPWVLRTEQTPALPEGVLMGFYGGYPVVTTEPTAATYTNAFSINIDGKPLRVELK